MLNNKFNYKGTEIIFEDESKKNDLTIAEMDLIAGHLGVKGWDRFVGMKKPDRIKFGIKILEKLK